MNRKLEDLRNLGIIAHIDAGKTTVTERMLYYTGTTHRMGEVDKGTTTTDFNPEEQQRGITIYGATVTFKWADKTINLIDTPGHVDFTAEVERSLRVLDGAVVVFSSREGVEAQSETVWRQADHYRIPRICFINKMDREGADFENVFNEIRDRLHANPIAVQIPFGAGPPHVPNAFRGIIDLIDMKLLLFEKEDEGKTVRSTEIPDEIKLEAEERRQMLLEGLVDFSDEITELMLEEQPIPPELIRKTLREATLLHQLSPVFCGSALDFIGIQPLLDGVAAFLPSPLDVPPVEGIQVANQSASKRRRKKQVEEETKEEVITRKADPDEPFCGLVFKVVVDKHSELSFVRVYSGKLKANSRVVNPRNNEKENVSQLWLVQADRRSQIQEISAGDIVGIIGLKNSVTGDTLCDPQHPILLESITFPETVISMAIEPDSSSERKKLASTLDLLKRQDPTFRAVTNEDTGQTLISGMGELHLEIIKNRLLRDFNLNVKVHRPRVSYRETIKRAAEAEGICERQVAGQTMFGKVKVEVEPYEDPHDPVVIESDVPDSLPEEAVNPVIESLTDQSQGGGLLGFPLMKVKVTLVGIEYPEEDLNDTALRIAASDAFIKALREAGVSLLEPIMKLTVTVPEDHMGDIVGDLQQRRAQIMATTIKGPMTIIEAEVPLDKMFGYSGAMRSLSQGRASCSMEPLNYQPAPDEVTNQFL
ncbi:Translation elongation factor G [Planctomycetales bacterium 10988]|nr:Translation elongation factor G [Planctomycetales bacterium 10988]